MLKLLANAAAAMALTLSASVAAPAWSAGKPAATAPSKCKNAKHRHTRRAVPAQPARGGMLVEHRKQDVQILSFGP